MNFPSNLKYTKDHEWILIDGNIATVGITDFAQSELGDIVFCDINSVGKSFAAGDVFGSVEAVKTVSDLFMPIAGKITEVNAALEASPELVNNEPYTNGWMIKMEIENPSQIDDLLSADDYAKMVG